MEELLRQAVTVRENAYAPYSGYRVGAAVEGNDGRIWTGVNFENVSYGATICAERSAIAKMVTDGGREIAQVAIATQDGGTPCGICLQVIAEFSPDPEATRVLTVDEEGSVREFSLRDLVPFVFDSTKVKRT